MTEASFVETLGAVLEDSPEVAPAIPMQMVAGNTNSVCPVGLKTYRQIGEDRSRPE